MVSEVAALKVEHLDDAGGCLHVVNGKSSKRVALLYYLKKLNYSFNSHTLSQFLHRTSIFWIFDKSSTGFVATL